ncbi:MAG: peptidoglycan D,D-transpeptidase FtsI family protein, partial [Coprobacillaceae bacterium]
MMNQFKGAKVAYVIFALVIFGLICNIIYIGATGKHFLSGAEIEAFAKTRGTQEDTIYADRGEIYSSDGEVIANSVSKYKLVAYTSTSRVGYNNTPAHVQDAQATAEQVAPLIGMDTAEMASKLQTAMDNGSYQVEFGTYGSSLSSLTVEKIKETGLTGLDFTAQTSRNYPMGDFASYIVGYAQVQEEKTTKAIVGKMGLELAYDEELSGTNGRRVYQVDSNKNILPNGILEEEESVDGNDVHLTINASLQRDLDIQLVAAAEATGSELAACAIMEAKTGKILAISNYPSFNPNERDVQSYQNFFFEQTYECGSVFKPFVYASIIEDGKYNGSATYQTGSYEVYPGRSINDWKPSGWGVKDFDTGLALSSNTAIANLIAKYADQESLKEDYKKLGFFQGSEIDCFSSPSGTAAYDMNDALLENITTGYGQGSTVTPLQLLRAYSVFANDGRTVEPYFVDRIVDQNTNEIVYSATPTYSEQIFSSETISQMNDLLLNNMESEWSVAKPYRLDDENIKLIGKTGTGQISEGTTGYTKEKYSFSYAGLAPYDDPEIIILTVFQCADNPGTATTIGNLVKTMVPAALATKASYTSSPETTTTSTYDVDSFVNQRVNYV